MDTASNFPQIMSFFFIFQVVTNHMSKEDNYDLLSDQLTPQCKYKLSNSVLKLPREKRKMVEIHQQVCLLTTPYQAPHLVDKILVLKDVAVFSFPGVLYGWILQSDLTLLCDLEWPLDGR